MNNVLEASTAERQPLTLDEAEDAILARWEDPQDEASDSETEAALEIEEETNDQPEFDEEDTYEEVDLEEEDTDPEDTDEQQEEDGDEAEEAEALADDAEVEILVDGETHRASVADLKRLYGQEASLTRKSQAVSQQRKQAEDAMQRSDALLQAMLSRAEERFKPYSEVDMLLASKTMDAEDFAALRKEAQAASEDVRFLREEADNFYGELRKQHEAAQKQAASEAVKVLQDAIPDWSNETYADIRSYAVAQGLDSAQVDQIVDPSVIQIINKARLFDQGKRVATVKKKAATQKKVLRSKKSPPNATARRKADIDKQRAALRNNRGTDLEDIASVLMSRWET